MERQEGGRINMCIDREAGQEGNEVEVEGTA